MYTTKGFRNCSYLAKKLGFQVPTYISSGLYETVVRANGSLEKVGRQRLYELIWTSWKTTGQSEEQIIQFTFPLTADHPASIHLIFCKVISTYSEGAALFIGHPADIIDHQKLSKS